MKLKQILLETRQWAEIIGFKYNYPDNLMGLCAIVSKELFARLKDEGYDCYLGYNPNHCFVVYKNRIIDLTATQFKQNEICIKKISKRITEPYWQIREVFTNVDQLSNYQKYNGWHKSQIYLPSCP